MTEIDFSAGETAPERDNAEQENPAPAGGHTEEVDLNEDASGFLAALQRIKSEVDATYNQLLQHLGRLATTAQDAISATPVPAPDETAAPAPEAATEAPVASVAPVAAEPATDPSTPPPTPEGA